MRMIVPVVQQWQVRADNSAAVGQLLVQLACAMDEEDGSVDKVSVYINPIGNSSNRNKLSFHSLLDRC